MERPTPTSAPELAGAEKFFTSDSLDLGTLSVGSQSIKLEYFLDYNSGALAASGAGFGFTYDFATAPLAAAQPGAAFAFTAAPLTASIPEPSTWAMMLVGFAGLAFASYCASRKGARNALPSSSLSTPSILGGVFSFPPAVS